MRLPIVLIAVVSSVLIPGIISLRKTNTNQNLVVIDQLRREFIDLEDKLWLQILGSDNELNNVKELSPAVALIKQYKAFDDVFAKEHPYDVIDGLGTTLDTSYVWARVYAELRAVHALYETFRRFARQQAQAGRVAAPHLAWLDLARGILLDGRSAMPETVKRLRGLIDGTGGERDEHRVTLMADVAKELAFARGTEGCVEGGGGEVTAPRQVMIAVYENVAAAQLKAYVMEQFGFMLLKVLENDDFSKNSTRVREDYILSAAKLISSTQQFAGKTSNDIWMCDPTKKHVKDDTYVEITQLLQGYVQNEVDLNPEGTCSETCSDYTYTKSHSCYKNLYCRSQRRCNGKIINCRFIDSDMWVCPADASSGRRYQYIEYENGRVLGRKQGGCAKSTVKVDSWWRWLFWHCSYCMCLCDEQGTYSDRYVNLRSALADVKDNMVVTGLRFVKKQRIIHLQVQQGVLLARGRIDRETVQWKPVEEYRITDKDKVNGQDYQTLTWEKRAIDLDDLSAGEGHVITGVRFKMIGSHLNFEIYTTPYNFTSGRLVPEKSVWVDNPITDLSKGRKRSKVRTYASDVPTRIPQSSRLLSKPDQYIEFTHTDFERDAAQTTVPFLDSQPVTLVTEGDNTNRPVRPLSGAGTYYKAVSYSGGFVGLKIMPLDVSSMLAVGVDNLEPEAN